MLFNQKPIMFQSLNDTNIRFNHFILKCIPIYRCAASAIQCYSFLGSDGMKNLITQAKCVRSTLEDNIL